MSAPDDNRIGRMLASVMNRKTSAGSLTSCPEEETLTRYFSGNLTDNANNQVAAHLLECSACMDSLSGAYVALRSEETEQVPRELLVRAKHLAPSATADPDIFDIVVQFVRESIELVSTTGQVIDNPAIAGIRGKKESLGNSILAVEKVVGTFKVAVEVERVRDELCQIALTLKNNRDSVSDRIRFTLLSKGREQASFLARRGTAVFEEIPPGQYGLALSKSGKALGSIWLSIKGDPRGT